jgi:hypothetical protein
MLTPQLPPLFFVVGSLSCRLSDRTVRSLVVPDSCIAGIPLSRCFDEELWIFIVPSHEAGVGAALTTIDASHGDRNQVFSRPSPRSCKGQRSDGARCVPRMCCASLKDTHVDLGGKLYAAKATLEALGRTGRVQKRRPRDLEAVANVLGLSMAPV